jgi:hypothetical protein
MRSSTLELVFVPASTPFMLRWTPTASASAKTTPTPSSTSQMDFATVRITIMLRWTHQLVCAGVKILIMPRWALTASAIVQTPMHILIHQGNVSAKMNGQPSMLVTVSAFAMILTPIF